MRTPDNGSQIDYVWWFGKRSLGTLVIIIGIAAIVIGIIMFSPPPRYQTLSWLETPGRITRSSLTKCRDGNFYPDVAYTYSVDDRTYTGSGFGVGSAVSQCVTREEAQGLLGPFPIGPKNVWYERSNPTRSSLLSMANLRPRSSGWDAAWGFFVAGAVALLVGLGVVKWSGRPRL